MAAALLEMVCNLTIGKPAYAEHDETMTSVRDRASSLRSDALGLAQEDAEAFGAVTRLPPAPVAPVTFVTTNNALKLPSGFCAKVK